VVSAFQQAHPEVTTALTLLETPQKLPPESWDVLVHVGEVRDTQLISQRIAPNLRIACAAPDYLAAKTPPMRPDDLARHRCIALRENDEDVTLWRFTSMEGEIETLRVSPRMASNDGDVVRNWALDGQGIIIRSEWDVADDVTAGRLVRVLPDWTPPAADIRVLMGERSGRTERTNRFIAMMKQALSPPPWREA
jgi:DNA-binding transcriptional LysR family regulator